ncbi:MAG: FecR domain-containing protein [Akkermansiaceae bacterium]|jgi:hypothetical protein|nr:FecR domain-containing protein [Akkermansiaceae bacterium]
MHIPDPDLLITRLLEGEATREEVADLLAACQADEGLRLKLSEHLRLHRLTGALLIGEDGESRFAAEVVARIQSTPGDQAQEVPLTIRVNLEKRLRKQVVVSRIRKALAIAAVLALAFVLTRFSHTRDQVILTRSESVVWTGEAAGVGEVLEDGRVLELTSGIAELTFPDGVQVLLEGPAHIRITGPKSARLERGRLVARVLRAEGRGFVIDGPSGRVVDLGTEFGVSVGQTGDMEVHVLEGTVTAATHEQKENVVTLHKNEAMRLGGGTSQRIIADDGVFITDLPPMPGKTPDFIRWSFEELSGLDLLNSGKGLAESEADARLMSNHDAGSYAKRIEGRFGRALAFDGKGNFAESGFQGIPGQSPRTVSLWARIPKDLPVIQSYAMIGWGRVEGRGSAWQISANPIEDDGPLGALRVGTGRGAVVGSTDLRDGEWHHLTAVMYGGSPTTATHILLYVDGVLESTTRKSVRAIDTELTPNSHGVWLGRNLSRWSPDPPGASFFRGDLDEVHIFDAALDQSMILDVMQGSVPRS